MLVQRAVQAPKITIEANGFTQRPRRFSAGSDVSYGLVIKNWRTREDAVNVTLLVNFVGEANRVLGTGHALISRLPANSTFNYGGRVGIPTQETVVRLEVVIGAKSERRVLGVPPLVSDLVIDPRPWEPYVDSVRGQLLNTRREPMRQGIVGVILLDAERRIIGGGAGYAQGPLAHGAREAFSVSGSFFPVPYANAASAVVSVIPSYEEPSR